jgi:hypothetical protein
MAINKVDLTVSQLLNDLNEGYTWLKKDDLGYGSIETKYGANPVQIATIRKHPALKDAETTLTVFNIIDDTAKQDVKATPKVNKTIERIEKVEEQQPELVVETSNAVDLFSNL